MRVYLNFTPRASPYGGANSFLRTLMHELARHGVSFTADPAAQVDIALLNALTDNLDLARVRHIAERGVPIVHRKTGYRGRGVAELRREVDGVLEGDRRQIEFGPFVSHTIFKSGYSRDVFVASGFKGASSVIWNGVDESVFNMSRNPRIGGRRPRQLWRQGQRLRVVISTWSTDESKGFAYYRAIDAALRGRRDVVITLVGRVPDATRFAEIRVRSARRTRSLAELLKHQHVLLQLTRWESCSNALIEGLNCGLPAVYLESGANPEIAAPYGAPFHDDLDEALERLLPRYGDIVAALPENPYRISLVAPRYLAVLDAVARGLPVPADDASVSSGGLLAAPARSHPVDGD